MQRLAPRLAVITIALVFASGAFLAQDVAGQSGAASSLAGQICSGYPGSRPVPMMEGGYSPNWCEGRGLGGVAVRLTRVASPGASAVDRSATTDDAGSFAFADLSSGSYRLEASRDNFNSLAADIYVEGESYSSWTLYGKEVSVAGHVLTRDGNPIDGAEVRFCCDGETGTERVFRADASGAFSFVGPASWISFTVRAPGYQDAYEERLVDGTEALEFRLEKVPAQDARVSGKVFDQDGAPVAGARIWVSSYKPCCYAYDDYGYPNASGGYGMVAPSPPPYYGGENWTETDGEGKFSMHAYSGSVNLRVEKGGHATVYDYFEVAPGETASRSIEMMKFPAKTAHLTGRVVDGTTGNGLPYATINIRAPQFGMSDCSYQAQPGSPSPSPYYRGAYGAYESYPIYYEPTCSIQVRTDGSFEGMVTPGYSIMSVYHDDYRTCNTTYDAGGDSHTDCGPEHLSWTSTVVLAADGDTELIVKLQRRPEPDAVVSGYLVDSESGLAIPGAQISFSNQGNYGYGSATTDGDGSYRIRLRSGYHTVSVWASGYLPWEGVLDIPSGDETPFDVMLKAGQESYGGDCCYYGDRFYGGGYGGAPTASPIPVPVTSGGVTYTSSASPTTTQPPAGAASTSPLVEELSDPEADTGGDGGVSEDEQYVDLEGGLGPYDPEERAKELSGENEKASNGAPGLSLAMLSVGLLAALALRRRLR